jgi:hypothetical protein
MQKIRGLLSGIVLLSAVFITGCGDGFDDTFPNNLPAPIANADVFTVKRDVTSVVTAPGVLANDVVVTNNLAFPFAIADFTPETDEGGAVLVNADGSFTYTPPSGFTGVDRFQYTLQNGAGVSNTEVHLNVVP